MSSGGHAASIQAAQQAAGRYSSNLHAGSAAERHGEGSAPVRGPNYAPAARAMTREFLGSMQGHALAPVRNGYAGVVQGSQQMQGGKAFNPGHQLFTGNNPHINSAKMDMGKFFKTGMPSVNPTPAPIGFKNPMPASDDAAAQGLGASKTNDVQVREVTLEPTAYSRAYHDESQMKALLPEGSFVFQFLPHDNIERTMGVFHTVSTLNRFMRGTSSQRDESFKDGETFARMWRFAGVPMLVARHQGGMSPSNVMMDLCVRGQRNVKNIFAATGKTAQCGTHLYLLLRKFHNQDIQEDLKWADAHAQHNAPFFDYVAERAQKGRGERPHEPGRSYWQLVPHMTLNDEPPPMWMWNGPDWQGTYFHVGVVEQTDTAKQFPKKDEARVLATVFPDPTSNSSWQESFVRLNTLSINVGDIM